MDENVNIANLNLHNITQIIINEKGITYAYWTQKLKTCRFIDVETEHFAQIEIKDGGRRQRGECLKWKKKYINMLHTRDEK